jgi:hypothetical protein
MLVYEKYNDKLVRVTSDSNKYILEMPAGTEYYDVVALGTIENGIAVFKSGFTYVEGDEMLAEETDESAKNVDK